MTNNDIEKVLLAINEDIYNTLQKRIPIYAAHNVRFVATPKRQKEKQRLGQAIIIDGKNYGLGFMPFDSGDLSKSVRVIDEYPTELLWVIGSGLEYANWVEDGTETQAAQKPFRDGTKHFLDTYVDDDINGIVEESVEEHLDEFGEVVVRMMTKG